MKGLIVKSQSGFYTVQSETGTYICHLRGRLKHGPKTGDVIAIGDSVVLTPLEGNTGIIEEIEERGRAIVRLAPTPRGEYRQILIANPDQLVLVYACANPRPRLRMLDRLLVIAEKQQVPAVIVANKVDLVGEDAARELFEAYPTVGYQVIFTSVKQELGIDELKHVLTGKISALAGPSGVGKSSLMNAIQPGLGLAVREISQATRKGKHTTVVRELFPLVEGGYVADTPGLKSVGLWDIEPEELDAYFPELKDLVAHCQFSDCTHSHEPGCAVLQAVGEGRVHPERYKSYRVMREGEEEETA